MNLKRKEENKKIKFMRMSVGWLALVLHMDGVTQDFCFCVMFAASFTDKAMEFLQLLSGQMYLCSQEDLNSLP